MKSIFLLNIDIHKRFRPNQFFITLNYCLGAPGSRGPTGEPGISIKGEKGLPGMPGKQGRPGPSGKPSVLMLYLKSNVNLLINHSSCN